MNLKGRTAEASQRSVLTGSRASVTSISRLSQLMELAAARVMRPALREGESSVALSLDFTHASQFPPAGDLRAVATHQGANGRVHRFLVHVFDETGLVATGEHSRAVVPERGVVRLSRRGVGHPSIPLEV